ncbi:sugar transferase [Spirosoma taeanense]|uniref:Sugar transferase n=1 Tax=Spirosoma taeanense TaxID=2735870 RepID=A0A6M5Y3L3_9BACT|nr:sugar transferase [Spirosoma taeanense]QJW87996.1 sugar transferase [Spirosoma taeanense]
MLTSIDIESIELDIAKESHHAYKLINNPWKRPFDLLLATLVTVGVLIWMIPLVGLLIKATSPGPVFFVQWRTGRNGRPFHCYKFRTMLHDHQNITFRQAVHNDARITTVGRWLRRTNLDEMPQFLNVLIGNMSLVGPRPHAIQHDAEFWFRLPNYHKRYDVLPGITGLAQVRGARGLTDNALKMKHRLQYDLFYIRKHSLWQDIVICWQTAIKMFGGNTNGW